MLLIATFLSSKNSLSTSLTALKFKGLPGRGAIVAMATFLFLGYDLECATTRKISTLFRISNQSIPFGTRGVGLACWNTMEGGVELKGVGFSKRLRPGRVRMGEAEGNILFMGAEGPSQVKR